MGGSSLDGVGIGVFPGADSESVVRFCLAPVLFALGLWVGRGSILDCLFHDHRKVHSDAQEREEHEYEVGIRVSAIPEKLSRKTCARTQFVR